MYNKGKMPVEIIRNRMSLRSPQEKSLQILDDIMSNLDLTAEKKGLETAIHEKYPIFKEFERSFPSLTFALATGVGKTRLMGAFMVYLNQNYGIKNFFVVAPNLTIYEKLKKDFGEPNHPKYVFKGLQQYAQNPPNIITGENYKDRSPLQGSLYDCININIFNIGKINAEVRGGAVPQIKRLNEIIGAGYFNYLKGLNDLCLFMDESHHYRADAGFKVLNDLDPFLGVELTATPQVETSKGAVKFRNVVYEYSLAQAIGNFVKTPWVATKKGFNPKFADEYAIDKIKLTDGIILHRNTITELQAYADNESVKVVKPFVLVVCRDTTHAAEIMDYIKSEEFFDGYYSDKVIEVHSAQKGSEKDENIRLLLGLEDDDNKIEIVVHVNMLKEGWDVNNLYTIIPLRVATSLTLREQTIGRGLRLPYGRITGNDAVDRLTIVAHDKFEDIIRAANDENSIIKKEHIIEIGEDDAGEKEKIKSGTVFDTHIKNLEQQRHFARSDERKKALDTEIKAAQYVGQAIEEVTTQVVNIRIPTAPQASDKQGAVATAVPTMNFIPTKKDLVMPEMQELVRKKAVEIARRELEPGGQMRIDTDAELIEIDKKIQAALAPVIEEKIKSSIDIPNIALVAVGEGKRIIDDFDLDIKWLYGYDAPIDEIVIESLKSGAAETIDASGELKLDQPPAHYILTEVLNQNERIPYDEYADLLFKLVGQMLEFIQQGKTEQSFIKALIVNQKEIAREISNQITAHSHVTAPQYEMKILQAATSIKTESYTKYKADEVKKFTDTVPAYLIKKTVFGGFSKSCTDIAKFDSVPEQEFAIILERAKEAEKWLRPALGQLPITYSGGAGYQPDFIVETVDSIYIIEIKAYNEIDDDTVKLKAFAAQNYCDNVNKYLSSTAKTWHYRIITDIHIKRNADFMALLQRALKF